MTKANPAPFSPLGVILAGGKARRMGHINKALVPFAGQPLLDHVLGRLSGQVSRIILNSHACDDFFAYDLPVVSDPPSLPRQPGPLAGILAGMTWAANQGYSHIVTCPCDSPFLPLDLTARLHRAVTNDPMIALATSAKRKHPVVGLWPVDLKDDLHGYLSADTSSRKILDWVDRHPVRFVDFIVRDQDPFTNINTLADIQALESAIKNAIKPSPDPIKGNLRQP